MIDSEPVSGVQFLLYADNVDLQVCIHVLCM